MKNVNGLYYEVGSYSVEITPPLSIPYLAGNPRHQFFTGIHDPLYASVVVVSGGSNEVVIVTIDGIGISNDILGKDRNFSGEIKERIENATGIKKEAIIILSGHIHSTPDTINFRPLINYPATLPWLKEITEQICIAAKIAVKNKYKAQLKIKKGNIDGISKNRRGGECLDTEVIVLLYEALDKKKNIILVNYACHPVIVQAQEMVSADYVGAMRGIIKKGIKGVDDVLFIQGACGDIDPIRGWTCNFRDVYLTGAALAGEVIKQYGLMAASVYPTEPVKVNSISITVDLPSRMLPSKEEIEVLTKEIDELKPKYENTQSKSERDAIHEQLGPKDEAFCRIIEGNEPFEAEIQCIRMGNGVLVGIPGEPLCQMGLEIKEMFEPLISIPAGYANGYLGYIASPEEWKKGGYEVELGPWSKVGPQSYEIIMNTIAALKKENNDSQKDEMKGGI